MGAVAAFMRGTGGTVLLVVAVVCLIAAAFAVWVSNYQHTLPRPSRRQGQPPPPARRRAEPQTPVLPPRPAAPAQPLVPPPLPPRPVVAPEPKAAVDSVLGPLLGGAPAAAQPAPPVELPELPELPEFELSDEQGSDPVRAQRRAQLQEIADADPKRIVDAIRQMLTDDERSDQPWKSPR